MLNNEPEKEPAFTTKDEESPPLLQDAKIEDPKPQKEDESSDDYPEPVGDNDAEEKARLAAEAAEQERIAREQQEQKERELEEARLKEEKEREEAE